jgi:hypothetical protein
MVRTRGVWSKHLIDMCRSRAHASEPGSKDEVLEDAGLHLDMSRVACGSAHFFVVHSAFLQRRRKLTITVSPQPYFFALKITLSTLASHRACPHLNMSYTQIA